MDKGKKNSGPRILAVPFPSPGHTNPMMQLCKRLVSKGLKATMALTKFSAKTLKGSTDLVQIETVSDGGDEAGIPDRDTEHDVLARFKKNGSESLAPLINKYQSLGDPIVCVIYDSLLPWAVEVPKKFGLVSVAFFTQQSAVNFIVYHFYHKLLPYPVVELPVSIPGLPLLEHQDFPKYGMFPSHQEFVAGQFSTVKMADFAFVNTFYKLEEEVLGEMSKVCPMKTVGPTIPSFYLDNIIENDKDYGFRQPRDASECLNWLNSKPSGSVVYVSLSTVAFSNPGAKSN
ncbi:UDP-glycosyltransferase 74F2 [Forsythia ovata]|uniref:UDP-glycosyltransferase 74F2 n=1 Tax=Forsythia ovata TaxID=205694 RepID=A0ABD1TAC3_9LAMI